ncbi:hypothetical protein [Sporomusa aerivorans]|uniref:hypothetical protein n=1 Tax=Sporomusa aerivorans TaxID=204936 RepID=UPI00352A0474
MAYTKTSITTPNQLLVALSTFATSSGWTVLYEGDDTPIDGTTGTDGKRLVIQSPGGDTFAHFRAANGKNIFTTHNTTGYMYGVGLTCSTAYTESPTSGKWFDQTGACQMTTGEVIGCGIPIYFNKACNVYFNHISDPAEMITISVELFDGVFQHMAVGETYKIGSWTGGTIFSASRNSANMFVSSMTSQTIEATSDYIFAVNARANTFLRANIDAAPNRSPEVLWGSAGPATATADAGYTGKRIALPVFGDDVISNSWYPKIPHYRYIQSQSTTDTGRNVNTLNCISVNLPLAVYVLRDPDALSNFSQVGYVPGIYFISTRNVAPASTYDINYPASGNLFQSFPQTSRGGSLGYDGISIKQ